MPDRLRNRRKGEPLPTDVEFWNELLAAARKIRDLKIPAPLDGSPAPDLQLVNTSPSIDYAQFALVAVGACSQSPIEVYKENDVFAISPVSATNFWNQRLAVLQRAAPKNSNIIVPAIERGITTVKISGAAVGPYLKPNAATPTILDTTTDPTPIEFIHCHGGNAFAKANLIGQTLSWLALTPGGGIPERSGTTCGSAVCTLYYLAGNVITATSPARTVVVRNTASAGVAAGVYIQVKPVAGGWVVDWEDCGA